MHANSKYSDEVKQFAIDMWMKDKKTTLTAIRGEIISKFGVSPSVDTVSDFLKITGEYKPKFYRSEEVEFKKRVGDAKAFKSKMSRIKTLKQGDKIRFIIYFHPLCGGQGKRLIEGKIIHKYNGYFLTDKGTCRFEDVKEVLKGGQEKQKETGVQSAS